MQKKKIKLNYIPNEKRIVWIDSSSKEDHSTANDTTIFNDRYSCEFDLRDDKYSWSAADLSESKLEKKIDDLESRINNLLSFLVLKGIIESEDEFYDFIESIELAKKISSL